MANPEVDYAEMPQAQVPQDIKRYMMLWAAVLEFAIREAAITGRSSSSSTNALYRERARAWLLDPNSRCAWICALCGIDPELARESIKRRGWESVANGLIQARDKGRGE